MPIDRAIFQDSVCRLRSRLSCIPVFIFVFIMFLTSILWLWLSFLFLCCFVFLFASFFWGCCSLHRRRGLSRATGCFGCTLSRTCSWCSFSWFARCRSSGSNFSFGSCSTSSSSSSALRSSSSALRSSRSALRSSRSALRSNCWRLCTSLACPTSPRFKQQKTTTSLSHGQMTGLMPKDATNGKPNACISQHSARCWQQHSTGIKHFFAACIAAIRIPHNLLAPAWAQVNTPPRVERATSQHFWG